MAAARRRPLLLVLAAAAVAAAVLVAPAEAVAAGGRMASVAHLRAGRRALARERARVEAGQMPTCSGLVGEMCKPCPSGGPAEFCTNTKNECAALFCSPMCRRNTWKCEVKFSGSMTLEQQNPLISEALCGEFKAQGCSKILDCCADNDELFDYVENFAFQKAFPEPLFPTPSCLDGPKADLCSACKSGAKVVLTPHECPFPSPEGGDGTTTPKNNELAKDKAGKPFPGINAHKGVQERCLKLEEKVKAKFGAMTSQFQENVCKCMGCCEGECFFPVTERIKAGGWETGI